METDDNLGHFRVKHGSEDESVHGGLPTDADHERLRTELLSKLPTADQMDCLLCVWLGTPQDVYLPVVSSFNTIIYSCMHCPPLAMIQPSS